MTYNVIENDVHRSYEDAFREINRRSSLLSSYTRAARPCKPGLHPTVRNCVTAEEAYRMGLVNRRGKQRLLRQDERYESIRNKLWLLMLSPELI
jgi:hypothetical protein